MQCFAAGRETDGADSARTQSIVLIGGDGAEGDRTQTLSHAHPVIEPKSRAVGGGDSELTGAVVGRLQASLLGARIRGEEGVKGIDCGGDGGGGGRQSARVDQALAAIDGELITEGRGRESAAGAGDRSVIERSGGGLIGERIRAQAQNVGGIARGGDFKAFALFVLQDDPFAGVGADDFDTGRL